MTRMTRMAREPFASFVSFVLKPYVAPATADIYRLIVLSRKGRFVAVVEVTVMSPRAVIVYTRLRENPTSAREMVFVEDPVYRARSWYTPLGSATNAPAPLYATGPPMTVSCPLAFTAYSVRGFAFEIAWTNRTYATVKSIVGGNGSSTMNESTVFVVVL